MSAWQIFLLYFLKFGTLDGSPFYQQLYLLGMECGNSITSHIISGSTRIVKSRIDCASYCLTTTACGTILFDNKIEYGQEGLCTLVTESSPGSPYVLENNSSVCFMKKSSVETTPSMGEIIIDIIDNVYDMCTTTSKYDIAIVTTNGVHLYDYTQTLTTGACRNMTIAELFQGFASLPDSITWKALLNFNNTYFDLFTDAGQVYRWKKDSGSIVPVSGYPKTEQAYIADVVHYTPTNIFSGARWAVYTHLTGVATLYFFDASKIYYHRSQPPHEGSFSINDTTNMDNNGRPINLWYNLPSKVVGVTEHENLHTSLFIVVDVNLNVYFYHLPDPNDVNTSPPVCSLQGQLRL